MVGVDHAAVVGVEETGTGQGERSAALWCVDQLRGRLGCVGGGCSHAVEITGLCVRWQGWLAGYVVAESKLRV